MKRRSDYLHDAFTRFLCGSKISTVVELGTQDGSDAILLRDFFAANVYCFECNPEILPTTRATLLNQEHITLVERAVWDEEKLIHFYPVTATVEGNTHIENPGASSCFLARQDYRQIYTQKVVTVPAIRLDTYCQSEGIEGIDLLCVDLQGAALRALLGLGSIIRSVRYMILELERVPIYYGQDLYPDVSAYLLQSRFELIAEVYRDPWFSDYMYRQRTAESVVESS